MRRDLPLVTDSPDTARCGRLTISELPASTLVSQIRSLVKGLPMQLLTELTSTALPASPQPLPRYRALLGRMVLALVLLLASTISFAPSVYAEDGVHVVARGESLGMIARRYNISVSELIAQNGISNPNYIYTGQRLAIPGATTGRVASSVKVTGSNAPLPSGDGYHTVGRGDTLSQIANSNGLTLADLLRLNGLTNPNLIRVGQELRVTARVAPVVTEKESKPKLADAIYVFKPGDSLATIAEDHNTTVQALLNANGLPSENFVWVGQRLRVQAGPKPSQSGSNFAAAPADGYRWIEVNLSTQMLTAWQGDVAVMHTYISSGLGATPTVTGRFSIGRKYSSQRMVGPGYDLPGVPWVMYFYGGYAIHGAYWHNNFGRPMSHGCVNMSIGDSQMLYNWAPMGTEVYVHY